MIEKNIDTFAKVLENINLKETAKVFREEFKSKSNDEYELGKINILKHLQNQLNKCTGNNIIHKYSPISTKKKKRIPNDIFDNLIKKLKIQKISENEKIINPLSKVYLNVKDKIEKEYQNSIKKDSQVFNSTDKLNYYLNEDYQENNKILNKNEDLPHFGMNDKEENNNNNNNLDTLNNSNKLEEDSLFTNNNINSNNENTNEENIINNTEEKDILNQSFGANEDSKDIFQNVNYKIGNSDKDMFNNKENNIEEYVDDDDPGFDLYECDVEYFRDTCKKLAEQSDFPHRGVYKSKYKNYTQMKIDFIKPKNVQNSNIKLITTQKNKEKNNNETIFKINNNPNQENIWNKSKLTKELNFPYNNKNSQDDYYPVFFKDEFIDCYDLKVIVDRERTGFEESKDFKIVLNTLVAGRYLIKDYLGHAAFSKAVKCLDIKEDKEVCLKIVENNKDYFDQSLDEIKVLIFINKNGDSEEKHFLKLYDYFYYKEHLFIVTELLKDNLYDFYDYTTKQNMNKYFTLTHVQKIAKQILICLEYIHSLHLIHCDLKPENILIKSIKDSIIKVIDFGSSSFVHDSLAFYIQSRSYRAPEVILGCNYDYKIDIWSLGCILAELYSGNVLFQSDSIQNLLARVIGIIGPFPDWMFEKGKNVKDLFCKEKLLFMEVPNENNNNLSNSTSHNKKMHVIVPKKTLLKNRLHCNDENFIEFIRFLLQIDPNERPSAKEALEHPWFNVKYNEND